MSFVRFLSSIISVYYICADFNIHVDVPAGNSYKFMTFVDSCDLEQSVNIPIVMMTYLTSFYPFVIRMLLLMLKSVILYMTVL